MCYSPKTELECRRVAYDEARGELIRLERFLAAGDEFSSLDDVRNYVTTTIANLDDEHAQPVCTVCGWTRRTEDAETYCRPDTPHSYPGWEWDADGHLYVNYGGNAAVPRHRDGTCYCTSWRDTETGMVSDFCGACLRAGCDKDLGGTPCRVTGK